MRLIISIAMLLALLPSISLAQKPLTKEDTELAKRYYKLGEELYARSDYSKALDMFHLSYKYSGRGALLFNIARCHEALGEHKKAVDYYEKFLTSNPSNRTIVESKISNLKRLIEAKSKPVPAPKPVPKPKPKPTAQPKHEPQPKPAADPPPAAETAQPAPSPKAGRTMRTAG